MSMQRTTLLSPKSPVNLAQTLDFMMRDTADNKVAKRRVFYIPGFDPFHPRRYRELYRKEGELQAEISGYQLDLKAKNSDGPFGWDVTSQIDGQATQARVDVLLWSDIVKASMSSGIPQTYWQLARTAWTYIWSGALRRLMMLRKGPIIAALYPVGMLLLQLLLAYACFRGAQKFIDFFGSFIPFDLWGYGASVSYGLGGFLGVLAAVAALQWFRFYDGKFFAYYLMHDYAFSAKWGGANAPELEARMSEFGDQIAAALASDADEVLIVGHSSGAHLAVSVLADLIREGRVPAGGPKLAFLSLGQVIPMMSFLPKAGRLRRDLHFLATQGELTWVDITAPGDGCAFALCDPVAVSGVEPAGKKWPLVVSAAFTQTLKPETWKSLRWRFFRLHFQYLCAFDQPGDYDYFQITAGPVSLAARYADRQPSRSRIDVAVSGHTSMAA
jgi:hypothetical protein